MLILILKNFTAVKLLYIEFLIKNHTTKNEESM